MSPMPKVLNLPVPEARTKKKDGWVNLTRTELRAIFHAPVSDSSKMTLLALRTFDLKGDGVVFPSEETLADLLNMSVRNVRRCIRQLEKIGLVTTTRDYIGQSGNFRNVYRLSLPTYRTNEVKPPDKSGTADRTNEVKTIPEVSAEAFNEFGKEESRKKAESNELSFDGLKNKDLAFKAYEAHSSVNYSLEMFLAIIIECEETYPPEVVKAALETYISKAEYKPYHVKILKAICADLAVVHEEKLKQEREKERKRFLDRYTPELKARLTIMRGHSYSSASIAEIIQRREALFPMHYAWMERVFGSEKWREYSDLCTQHCIEIDYRDPPKEK